MINTELAKLKLEIKLYESIELDQEELEQEKLSYSELSSLEILQSAWNWAHLKKAGRYRNLYIFYFLLFDKEPKIKNLIPFYQMFEVYLIVPQLYKQLCNYVNS